MSAKYIPEAGDIVWLNFTPQKGHEQAGHRPALVISPALYNEKRGMMICCPMTSQIKGYPFEVVVSEQSAVLSDQVKSLDWVARKASFKEKVDPAILLKVRQNIKVLLGL